MIRSSYMGIQVRNHSTDTKQIQTNRISCSAVKCFVLICDIPLWGLFSDVFCVCVRPKANIIAGNKKKNLSALKHACRQLLRHSGGWHFIEKRSAQLPPDYTHRKTWIFQIMQTVQWIISGAPAALNALIFLLSLILRYGCALENVIL